jgi:hypothetical protein
MLAGAQGIFPLRQRVIESLTPALPHGCAALGAGW